MLRHMILCGALLLAGLSSGGCVLRLFGSHETHEDNRAMKDRLQKLDERVKHLERQDAVAPAP